jgi:hypothetical protein
MDWERVGARNVTDAEGHSWVVELLHRKDFKVAQATTGPFVVRASACFNDDVKFTVTTASAIDDPSSAEGCVADEAQRLIELGNWQAEENYPVNC